MYKNSLVTIEDLSKGQIEDILDLAQRIEEDRDSFYGLASRSIMASLFLEPSTRTRGSFEAAMKRLGGDAITTADAKSSSMEKGESLADTIRIWGGYSDLIVLRHPWEGAARLAAEYSDVPVINAGDGSHEHPTQTLLDLYTLRKEFGTLQGLNMVLCGDLKHGRTVHSLAYALLRFGASIIFVPGEGLELPDHVIHKIETEYGNPIQEVRHPGLAALYGEETGGDGPVVDAIYMAPSQPHTPTLFDSVQLTIGKEEAIAFYVTRKQVERGAKDGAGSLERYPRIDERVLHRKDFSKAIVMHPLPRVDEISPAVDADPRSRYFEQARNGVPVRMALIALMMGLAPWSQGSEDRGSPSAPEVLLSHPQDFRCANSICVSQREPQNTTPQFTFFDRPMVRLVCVYCERETQPAFFRYPWGEVFWPIAEYPRHGVDPSQSAFFPDEATARTSGLRPPKRGEQETRPAETSETVDFRTAGGASDG